eukprot:5444699-Prymnesium_polylepis.1
MSAAAPSPSASRMPDSGPCSAGVASLPVSTVSAGAAWPSGAFARSTRVERTCEMLAGPNQLPAALPWTAPSRTIL